MSVVRRAATAAALISNYCDHIEHVEEADRRWVLTAAEEFRTIACVLAISGELRLHDDWNQKISRDPITRTMRCMQIAQAEYDREHHPDVFGRSRYEQLRHHAIKATVLLGRLCDSAVTDRELAIEFWSLGLRVSTVMHQKLEETLAERPAAA